MLTHLRNERGVTLVELMIVVAIMAIIAAIATSLYQDVQRKAKLAGDQGNVAALNSAVAIYYGTHNGTFPASLTAINALVVPAPVWNCGVTPVYNNTNGKITFTATVGDCS